MALWLRLARQEVCDVALPVAVGLERTLEGGRMPAAQEEAQRIAEQQDT